MIQTLRILSSYDDDYIASLENQYIDQRHYNRVIGGRSLNVVTEDGLLLMLRHRAIDPEICRRATPALRRAARKSEHRGYVSGLTGYYNCRATAFTRKQVESWGRCLPLIRRCDDVFYSECPARFLAQEKVSLRTPDKTIGDSVFTTMTVNRWTAKHDARTPAHQDDGDLPEGFGVIACLRSKQLFKPLVDQETWDKVQTKLNRPKRSKAPRSAKLYLAGLVYCGNCGARMVAGPTHKPKTNPRKDGSRGNRYEYFCGTYHKAAVEKRLASCPCRRNGVFQDELERYVDRWLTETKTKLELLNESLDASQLTEPLRREELQQWREFREGIHRLTGYLAKHHEDDYNEILRRQDEFTSSDDFVDEVVASYKRCFDPKRLNAERKRLDTEHDALMKRWGDVPTARAKEKLTQQLTDLEARMDELDHQSENLGEAVSNHYREVNNLNVAIAVAQQAMAGKDDERALRQRAEALRKVIQKIECRFTATGAKGGGWGKKNTLLTSVTVYPIVGEPAFLSADSMGTLKYSSAHSCM